MNDRTRLERFVPISGWLGSYQRDWLKADVLAGLTVWALVVPEAMAYAGIAGVPVEYGLYAVPLAVVAYAVFGTSRRLFVGPSSTIAALSASTVAPVVASGGTAEDYVALTAGLALLVGVLYVLMGLARMGVVARFFAKPVLDGFVVGLGIYIAIGQLPKLVGIEKADGNALQEFAGWITDISQWDRPSVLVGVLSLAFLVTMERLLPRVPAALVVVVASIIAAQALDLGVEGVALVGEVPTGFHFAPWSSIQVEQLIDMLPGALAIIVVGFAESLAVAKTYAAKHRETIDANQEMVAYGAANLGAGVLQGYSVSGSLSKSAAAEAAGAKTPLLMGVVSGAVLLTIAVIAGVFEWLPEPTLAAIIIVAVAGMIDPTELKRLWDARAIDFALALGALLGVLIFDILGGVVVGVVLSLVLVIHRLDNPHVAILGTDQDATTYRDLAENPEHKSVPGVLIYRFDAPLIFTNADFFKDDISQRVRTADPAYHRVILDLEAVYEIDTTGLDALLQIKDLLDADSITLDLARVKTDLRGMFDRMQATDRLGPEHLHATIRDAVTAAT